MQLKLTLLKAVLDLFEGGAGAAGAPSGDSGSASAAGMQPGDNAAQAAEELTQGDAGPQEEAPAPTLEERTKAYKELVTGEYKDIHTSEMQKIINRRFAETKNLQQQVEGQQAIIDRLASKYGTDDLQALGDAIDHDTSLWEEEADRAGLTTDQYVKIQALERQNARLIKAQAEQAKAAERQQRIRGWMAESDTMKQQFPGFDLETELANPRFGAMLQSGVPMKDAYQVMHFDEIQNLTAQAAAHQAEANVTANIKAKGSRPTENGLQQQSAFTTKTDVRHLTRQDRAELAERARRGETITFAQ
mgnify:CR=1 FL=1